MAKSKAAKLKEYFERLSSLFSRSEKKFLEQRKENLSVLESKVLYYIGENNLCIMKEISNQLEIPKNNLTVIVDKLEKKKLVKRLGSDKDRRTVSLQLTPKGEIIYEEHAQFLIDLSKDFLKSLTRDEQNQLLSVMEKFFEN